MSKKRPIISKFNKERILAKTHRRCAYCGCALHESNTTIDHVKCIASGVKKPNEMSNLLPCCLECNRKKASLTLEQFRQVIFGKFGVLHALKDNPEFRLAQKYGLIKEQLLDDRFYFERQGSMSREALLEEFLSGKRKTVVFKKEEPKVTIDEYVNTHPEVKENLDDVQNSSEQQEVVADDVDVYQQQEEDLPFNVSEYDTEPLLYHENDHGEVLKFIEDLSEDLEDKGVDLSYIKGYLTAAWRFYNK